MRYYEFSLNETTEEDRAIISLASAINQKLIDYNDQVQTSQDDDDYNDDEYNAPIKGDQAVTVGTVGQLFNTPLDILNPVHIMVQGDYGIRLRMKDHNVESFKSPDKSVVYGLWYGGQYPKMIFNQDFIGSKYLLSVISHELRHALDDFKSDHRAGTSKKYGRPKKKYQRRGKNLYLAQPSEINARFIQVLNSLVPIIKRTYLQKSPDKIKKEIIKNFYELLDYYNIAELFPEKEESRDYKRLIKRGIDFISKESNHVEQEFAQRGIKKTATGNW